MDEQEVKWVAAAAQAEAQFLENAVPRESAARQEQVQRQAGTYLTHEEAKRAWTG